MQHNSWYIMVILVEFLLLYAYHYIWGLLKYRTAWYNKLNFDVGPSAYYVNGHIKLIIFIKVIKQTDGHYNYNDDYMTYL